MKKKIVYSILSLILLLTMAFAFSGCPEMIEVETQPAEPTEAPGPASNVRAYWSGGDLYYAKKSDRSTILKFDGTNGDTEITIATIASETVTTATITTGTVTTLYSTTANITTLGSYAGGLTINGATIESLSNNGTITIPTDTTDTLVGKATTDVLTNKTLTSPAITSPTITGTGTIVASSGNFSTLGTVSGSLAITATSLNMGGYTMTFPSSAQTLVGRTTTDTLTNKTLTLPIIASISNNGTITFPADTTDTLVGKATTNTLTNKTLTSPVITSPTVTGTGSIIASSANFSTLGTVSSVLVITASSATITDLDVTTGTFTNLNATTANFTTIDAYGGSLTITSASLASPTITGTSVVANREAGTATLTAGTQNISVAHGMTGTPTIILLTFNGYHPGTSSNASAANPLFWSSANSTHFYIEAVTTTNITVYVSWLALIASE